MGWVLSMADHSTPMRIFFLLSKKRGDEVKKKMWKISRGVRLGGLYVCLFFKGLRMGVRKKRISLSQGGRFIECGRQKRSSCFYIEAIFLSRPVGSHLFRLLSFNYLFSLHLFHQKMFLPPIISHGLPSLDQSRGHLGSLETTLTLIRVQKL